MAETAYYTSYIARERHAIVDAAVAASLEVLCIPEVKKRLGKYAVDLAALLEMVAVPNIQHNKLCATRECRGGTAITAVHPREVTFRNPIDVYLHDRQKQSLYDGFSEETAEELIARQRDSCSPFAAPMRINSLVESSVLAQTIYNGALFESDIGTIQLQTAPTVFIDANNSRHREPIIMLHELLHVEQVYEYPVIMPSDEWSRLQIERELEAYHVESQVIHGYKDARRYRDLVRRMGGTSILEDVMRIDDVCAKQQTNINSPFDANDDMLEALASANLNLA